MNVNGDMDIRPRTLLDATRDKVRQLMDNEVNMRKIAAASHGYISYAWLYRFYSGMTPDPGIQRVQLLSDLCDHLLSLPEWVPHPDSIAHIQPMHLASIKSESEQSASDQSA